MAEAAPGAATATTPPATAPAVGAASTATPPAAGATPPLAATPPAPGTEGFVMPADLLEWSTNKGYNKDVVAELSAKHPNEFYKMLTSYRESEKVMHAQAGADKMMVPKDLTDFAQIVPALEKMGAPKDAAGYKLEVPQGLDNAFGVKASEWFAEAKLLPAQAALLNKKWNEHVASIRTEVDAKAADDGRTSITQLETEWGADVKHNSEISARGFNKLAKDIGMTPERVEEIKNSNSVKLTAYEFAKLTKAYGDASKVTGDRFEGGGPGAPGTAGAHSPETARAEKTRLLADPAFAGKYLKRDAEARKAIDQLDAIIAPTFSNPT